jgi:RimJ/RimL family protein N-acetyltransferase
LTDVALLHGDVVVLAPLREEDSPLLFKWINDPELVTLSAPFRPISRRAHDAWFTGVQQRPDTRIFGIRLRDGDRLAGSCQLHSIHPSHRSAELQIRIGADDVRGRGIGTEATQLLVRHGFEQLDLHRIYLHVFETNEPAKRLYRRVGFRTEGVLREAAWIEEKWVNVILMALLRSEYRTA